MCSNEQADWRIDTMRQHFQCCEVFGYERLIEAQTQMSDIDDRHVVAAAIVGAVDQIVTFNSKHFPSIVEPNGIEVISPDEFLLNVLSLHPMRTIKALKNQAAILQRPPMGLSQVLASLSRCGVPDFARKAELVLKRGINAGGDH